ncbi:hypothetical protein NX059_012211 [Plenodomus lindquistii]|nr:hypothetical protein NX059_012211 [Plenodomus lindquistii]
MIVPPTVSELLATLHLLVTSLDFPDCLRSSARSVATIDEAYHQHLDRDLGRNKTKPAFYTGVLVVEVGNSPTGHEDCDDVNKTETDNISGNNVGGNGDINKGPNGVRDKDQGQGQERRQR